MKKNLPGIGFIAAIITYFLVILFFIFGFKTPSLDRVWTLHHLLKTGRISNLNKTDIELLNTALLKHDKLASSLLDGKEIGIISANLDGWVSTPSVIILHNDNLEKRYEMWLDIHTPKDLLPFTLELEGKLIKKKIKIKKPDKIKVELPETSGVYEILKITMLGTDFKNDPSVLGIRVTFSEVK